MNQVRTWIIWWGIYLADFLLNVNVSLYIWFLAWILCNSCLAQHAVVTWKKKLTAKNRINSLKPNEICDWNQIEKSSTGTLVWTGINIDRTKWNREVKENHLGPFWILNHCKKMSQVILLHQKEVIPLSRYFNKHLAVMK